MNRLGVYWTSWVFGVEYVHMWDLYTLVLHLGPLKVRAWSDSEADRAMRKVK